MEGVVCMSCHSWLPTPAVNCPHCQNELILDGETKNVIDSLQPDCLIHRYDGSDLLEPAVILKEGKTNMRVATKLIEYNKPISVPKTKVYAFSHAILSSVQSLRNERTATMRRFDQQIQAHWQRLKPYHT